MKQIFDKIVAWVKKYKDNIIPILVLVLVFIVGAMAIRHDFSKENSYEPKNPEEVSLDAESSLFLEAGSPELKDSEISSANVEVVKVSDPIESITKMTFNALCVSPEKEISVSTGTKVKFENIQGETKSIKILETVYSIPQYKYRTYTFNTAGSFEVSCDSTVVGTVVVK